MSYVALLTLGKRLNGSLQTNGCGVVALDQVELDMVFARVDLFVNNR